MDREKMLEFVSQAEEEDIGQMITEIIRRQKELYPDWEGMYISFPLKSPDECRRIMETIWKILIQSWE